MKKKKWSRLSGVVTRTCEMSWLTMDSFDPPNLRACGEF